MLRLGVLLVLAAGCSALPSSKEAGVSYATTESPWPASVACLNPPGVAVAREVLNGRLRTVLIAGGPNAIPEEAWPGYTPSLGNTKNSDRFLLFTRSCFARSPSKPASCEGEDCRELVTMDGYSWVALSKIVAADCWPDASKCEGTTARPGGLLAVVTQKCHELVFENEIWVLTGPDGERAIMHATADGVPTSDVVLPAGWSLQKETLTAPLVLHPFGGGDACFYNIIRDHRLQSYHQVGYRAATYP